MSKKQQYIENISRMCQVLSEEQVARIHGHTMALWNGEDSKEVFNGGRRIHVKRAGKKVC